MLNFFKKDKKTPEPKEVIPERIKQIKPIVTNLVELRKPCVPVEKGEDVSQIIQELKDTLETKRGWGLSANQIGYNKKISYIKIPEFKDKQGNFSYKEYILINAKIIEKDRLVKVLDEGCLSFPGVPVHTQRYVFITIEYLNEKMEPITMAYQDMEALAMQHEVDHQQGRTIFDRKWRAR